MQDRIVLFHPHHIAQESDTFAIQYGGQMTILAVGLEPGDYIEFQAVHILTMDPDRCVCPPGEVVLPAVSSFVTLTCCGEPIRVTDENPIVVLDTPQRTFLRAKLVANDTTDIWAWAIDSLMHNVNDRMRGCACED